MLNVTGSQCKSIKLGVIWSNFAIWKITLAAAVWTFCKWWSWYFGMPNRSVLQQSRCKDTKAWISVFGGCTVRNFLICLIVYVYSPRKSLTTNLAYMWTFIRTWASNQDPTFQTLSKGLMTVSPMVIDSIDLSSSCWQVPIIRKSVFTSLIIKRFPIKQERTSAMHFSITERALISEWTKHGRKERYCQSESHQHNHGRKGGAEKQC